MQRLDPSVHRREKRSVRATTNSESASLETSRPSHQISFSILMPAKPPPFLIVITVFTAPPPKAHCFGRLSEYERMFFYRPEEEDEEGWPRSFRGGSQARASHIVTNEAPVSLPGVPPRGKLRRVQRSAGVGRCLSSASAALPGPSSGSHCESQSVFDMNLGSLSRPESSTLYKSPTRFSPVRWQGNEGYPARARVCLREAAARRMKASCIL